MTRRVTLPFDRQCEALGLPRPFPEWKFHPTRKWRIDWAYPGIKLGIEIDGGVFVQGRHSRGAGAEKDMEKYAEALVLGWRILRVTPRHVRSGRAVTWVQQLVKGAQNGEAAR